MAVNDLPILFKRLLSETSSSAEPLFSVQNFIPSPQVILDRYTEHSRGLGFAELSTQEDARRAMNARNGTDLDGHI